MDYMILSGEISRKVASQFFPIVACHRGCKSRKKNHLLTNKKIEYHVSKNQSSRTQYLVLERQC